MLTNFVALISADRDWNRETYGAPWVL